MDSDQWLAVAATAALIVGAALFLWARSHHVTVPAGCVVPVRRLGAHQRLLRAGYHVLLPGEEPGPQYPLAPRAEALELPEIRTHSGLAVTVWLRYRSRWLPEAIKPADLYNPPGEWTNRARRVFTAAVQEAVNRLPRAKGNAASGTAALSRVFGPFFSLPEADWSRLVGGEVADELREMGLELDEESVAIDRVVLPNEMTWACDEYVRSGFEAAPEVRFLHALRAEAPEAAPADLELLRNAIVDDVFEVRAVFGGTGFEPAQLPVEPSTAGAANSRQAGEWRNERQERDYPLTPADMELT